jgi:hypothetical protein
VIERLFYVRRHTGADGSFEWYVLNGHTRRRASKFFPTRAAAAAERAKLQVKLDLAKEQVLRRTPKRVRREVVSGKARGPGSQAGPGAIPPLVAANAPDPIPGTPSAFSALRGCCAMGASRAVGLFPRKLQQPGRIGQMFG